MMAFAPSRRAWTRGGSVKAGQLKPIELIQIRKLYLEKRYKQCVAACAERLEEQVSVRSITGFREADLRQLHPIHIAFLLFQQAVSYEAMGLAAHKYSRNRIPFFELAEEKFTSILQLLDQSMQTDSTLLLSEGEKSAAGLLNNSDMPFAPFPGDAFANTPTCLIEAPTSDVFTDSGSVYSFHSEQAPDFGKCSARPNGVARLGCIPRTVTFPDVDKQYQDLGSDTDTRTNDYDKSDTEDDRQHVLRLTASLSSTHILADNLVPLPLFKSRAKKAATIPFSRSTTGTTDAETVSTPQRRPLPHPQGHASQTPNAGALLPSPLPHTPLLPSPLQHTPLSCYYTDASIPSSAASTIRPDSFATPITPRFALIHSIFSHPHPQPVLPFNSHPSSPLSHDLSRYNAALSAFLTTVHTAISTTRCAITSTQELQDEHAAAKRRAFLANSSDAGKRMASYWDRATRQEVDNHGDEEDEAAKKQKQERIEKLRCGEWRVNKEKFGWKGSVYYDTLIREIDIEMRLGEGAIGVKQ
ncbi:hypothetical protein DV737_g1120, partial [Chaetothyriales sp. CBS 132003]